MHAGRARGGVKKLRRRYRGRNEYTALHLAADERRPDVVKVLLATGACDVDARSAAGDTALDFATLHGHAEVAAFLRDRAA